LITNPGRADFYINKGKKKPSNAKCVENQRELALVDADTVEQE
jgi:hypothetical protein